jgi:phosphohistidine swiveling domain-containing protein
MQEPIQEMEDRKVTSKLILPLKDPHANLDTVGGKGASLAKLVDAGFPVPDGFHVTTEAYRRFVKENDLQPVIDSALLHIDEEKPSTLEEAAGTIREAFMAATIPGDIASVIVGAYGDLAGTDPAVAVRSSATAEDLPGASFAGQQETYLNVSGADHVLEATKKCWSSLWTARAIGYRSRQGVRSEGVALAVVVQQLVDAEVAGILFTANPVDGRREHAMISASWGLGDAVVGGRVTPDEYVVEKESTRLVKREVSRKELMTVRVDDGTEDQPVPENLQEVPALQEEDLVGLSRLGVEIEDLYGMPMDIEWAIADGQIAIVQARPITALPEAVMPPPSEWQLPNPRGRYLRASIVDLMPDPLSPLFATMGIASYNASLVQAMADIIGTTKYFLPDELILTIQNYAYMTANFTAGEWWGMLKNLLPKFPRLIREGPTHFREVALPKYQKTVDRLAGKPVADMPAEEIWQVACDLMYAAAYHLAILQVDTLGAAAGSEGLFTALYNRFFYREGDPRAAEFLMGYDTIPVRSVKSLYDLADWAKDFSDLSEYLLQTPTDEIRSAMVGEGSPTVLDENVWEGWLSRIHEHVKAYGYIFYDFDFEKTIPAEDPTPALETVKMYLRGEGANPHERHQRLEVGRKQAVVSLMERARGVRGWAVKKALGWAQSMGEVREDSVASIGLSYPRLRELLKDLGRRMMEAGAIEVPTDIFWLYAEEVEASFEALNKGEPLGSKQDEVEARKASVEAAKKIIPPTQLPESDTYMGIPLEVFVPGEGGQEGDRLKGVGVSGGCVTGKACVLRGPEDFDQMVQGGILVAKMTTPAWTPLFAMAGGIVTDIGGPLSHGSIVAREYGIPAVLGTVAATRVIESGQQITVDGDTGIVKLTEG